MSRDKRQPKNIYYPPSPPSKGWTQQSPLEQLLLASQTKHHTIPEENQDQLFDLYITPYNQKQLQEARRSNEQHNEDTTILKFSKKDDGNSNLPSSIEDQKDSKRLKNIIDKKNRVIGELTEQLSSLKKDMVSIQSRRKNSYQNNSHKSSFSECSQCHCKRFGKQIEFFQKNNLELFEQLSQCRSQKQKWKGQYEILKNSVIPQLQLKMKELENSKRQLIKQNNNLLQEIKQYIDQGKKQMAYVNKMRNIITQKSGIKQLESDVRTMLSHQAINKTSKSQNRSKKITPFSADVSDRFAMSQSKKSASKIQKCLSIQMLQSKYKL